MIQMMNRCVRQHLILILRSRSVQSADSFFFILSLNCCYLFIKYREKGIRRVLVCNAPQICKTWHLNNYFQHLGVTVDLTRFHSTTTADIFHDTSAAHIFRPVGSISRHKITSV